MELIDDSLLRYAETHSTPESDLLQKINRETHLSVLMPRMLSSHLQGRLLAMISKMVRPKQILEIGTYTGYSALCLAEGLQAGGQLITIDNNEELEPRVKQYFKESGMEEKIDYRIGEASSIIPGLDGPFDLVFIDADKKNYSHYYDLVFDKMGKDSYILADNVLWSGKVIQKNQDKDTKAIVDFNKKISEDPRVEKLVLPVRDGITIVRKI